MGREQSPHATQPLAHEMLSKLAVAAEPCQSDASRAPTHILRHKQSQKLAHKEPQQLEQQSIDTEAGMLSGISQKHNMRSSPCRFTEFCNSQCLSHFAAPFIVDRTETSIAESCEQHIMDLVDNKWQQNALKEAVAVESAPASSAWAPPPPMRVNRGRPSRNNSQWFDKTCANDPSAGSPTETLLRLLLPLSDKVH